MNESQTSISSKHSVGPFNRLFFGLLLAAGMAFFAGCASSHEKALRLNTVEEYRDLTNRHPEVAATALRRIAVVERNKAEAAGTWAALDAYAAAYPEFVPYQFRWNMEEQGGREATAQLSPALQRANTIGVLINNRHILSPTGFVDRVDLAELGTVFERAGLKWVAPDDSDILLLIEFNTSPVGAYWRPRGTTGTEHRTWHWTGASAKGRVTLRDRVAEIFVTFDFSHHDLTGGSNDDWREPRESLTDYNTEQQAPVGRALVASGLPERLVYLLTLGKGAGWANRLRLDRLVRSDRKVPFSYGPKPVLYDAQKVEQQLKEKKWVVLGKPDYRGKRK